MDAADVVDVILRDGGTLRLRPPARDDRQAVVDFLDTGLSDESRYRRFHGVAPSEGLVDRFLEPDWQERGALIGSRVDDAGGEHVVALASYARLRDPEAAEVAFAVADPLQARGVGTRLLEQLAGRAAEAGISRFVAEVLPDNAPMLRVFEDAGLAHARELSGGVVEVEMPIAPTARFVERRDERDHVAVAASMRPFFESASVAVVGASPREATIGGGLFRNILRSEFAGAAYPVNRDGRPVAGVRAYRAVSEIPDAVELAVLVLPAAAVLDAAEDALRHGVRALVVITAGFAEVGSEGAERQERLVELVRAHGARLVGPNCLGIAVPGRGLNATFAARDVPPGNIGFSSQSGALGLALLEAAGARGLGFSAFVSVGNKADVSTNDLLEWWEDDDGTGVILMYVESFGNPRKFGRLARRVARRKPILALKSGTSSAGARAASSHTAALAGSEAAVDALFRQAGVIRAESLEELSDVATLLSTQPVPRGRRIGLVTNAGGLGILAADAADAAGLELADLTEDTRARLAELLPAEASVTNPVDMLGSAAAAAYEQATPVVLADPNVDALVALFVPAASTTADDVATALSRAAVGAPEDKPVLAVVLSGEGIPPALGAGSRPVAAFSYPESAVRALGRAAERGEWLRRAAGATPEIEGIDRDAGATVVESALARGDDGWLSPDEARRLLAAYGIRLVPERSAGSVDEAVAAAEELGYPAVVKTAAPGAHKTDVGGVALDLADADAVRAAAERIGPPFIVQPMLSGGAELLAGIVQDPVFGPLVAFGPGGVMAELIGEAGFAIAPLTDADAEALVLGGKAGRLVRGYRGTPAADAGALADLVHRLARLGEDLPAVAELDLNPVLARPDGCVALDVRVRAAEPVQRQLAKSW